MVLYKTEKEMLPDPLFSMSQKPPFSDGQLADFQIITLKKGAKLSSLPGRVPDSGGGKMMVAVVLRPDG